MVYCSSIAMRELTGKSVGIEATFSGADMPTLFLVI